MANPPAGFPAIHRTPMEPETAKRIVAAFDHSVSQASVLGIDAAQLYAVILDRIYDALVALNGEPAVIGGLEIFLKQQRELLSAAPIPRRFN
jgi:hypothetical protein